MDDLVLTRLACAERDRVAVALFVAEVIETPVALARPIRRRGVARIQIADHLVDRPQHAVEVETVETDLRRPVRICGPQPFDEFLDDGVAPHPLRESPKRVERLGRRAVFTHGADVPVDAVGVGPVALDGDRLESLLLDESSGHVGPSRVELVRAVAGLADQNQSRVTDEIEQLVVVDDACRGWHCAAPDRCGGVARFVCGPPSDGRCRQQLPDLVVGGLLEVPIGLAHRGEGLGSGRTDDLVHPVAQFLAGVLGCRGNGNDNLCRPQLVDGPQRCGHRRARRQAVVDHDHGLARDFGRPPAIAIRLLAAAQLFLLAFGDRLEVFGGDVQSPDGVVVGHHDAAGRNGTHGVLGLVRGRELADHEHVERSRQRGGHLITDRHPTTGQRQHDDIVAAPVMLELLCKHPPRLAAVLEDLRATHVVALPGPDRAETPHRVLVWQAAGGCPRMVMDVPRFCLGVGRVIARRRPMGRLLERVRTAEPALAAGGLRHHEPRLGTGIRVRSSAMTRSPSNTAAASSRYLLVSGYRCEKCVSTKRRTLHSAATCAACPAVKCP